MRCIQDIVEEFDDIEYSVFDVRGKDQVPGLEFDIYISTGGPGSPLEGDGVWDKRYARWLDAVWNWNLQPGAPKKYVFFICHSFQIAVNHFKLAKVIKRKSRSFGTFPCHKTDEVEPLFEKLPDPFYIADFRDWQAVQPDWRKIDEMGAKVVALEK
ncbi:MAG: GMP synthase, partial [Bacteroidetes bacterium]